MSYILEPISIATGGYIGPIPSSSDQCPAPIAIATDGYVRFAFVDQVGLADPYTGPNRFPQRPQHPPGWEPFDLSYFRTKYARQRQDVEQITPEVQATPAVQHNPEIVLHDIGRLEEILASIAIREAEAQLRALAAARELEEKERADTLAAELAHLELIEEQQRTLLAELEQNRIDARGALLLAMQLLQRQRNELAAIAATMQYFY